MLDKSKLSIIACTAEQSLDTPGAGAQHAFVASSPTLPML